MSGQEGSDREARLARLIWYYRLNQMQAELVNSGGWPLEEGAPTLVSQDELERAFGEAIRIRNREGPPKPGQLGEPHLPRRGRKRDDD